MMLLHSQSISYFKVKRTIWLKGCQNGNYIEASEQRLQEISIAKNPTRGQFFRNAYFLQPLIWRLYASGVTDGGEGGKCPLAAQMWVPFQK